MKCLLFVLTLLLMPLAGFSQQSERDREWNKPVEPFKIIGNIYYVGASEVTSFLITTPKGHFLLDSGFAETVPQIRDNIKRLGFKVEDVKFLLNTQCHFDHAAGLADLRKLTGGRMVASEGDKACLENGDRDDFAWGNTLTYAPVKVDRVVKDRESLKLGGASMKAVITPGHTRGCTTWTLEVKEGDRVYNAVFVCSASVPGYKLVGNEKYANIVSDYERTFSILKTLKADIFLGAHGSFFDLPGKTEKLRAGTRPNPFIDPNGYRDYVSQAEASFRESLTKERAGTNKP